MDSSILCAKLETATVESATGFGFTVLDHGAALQSIIVPTPDGPVNCLLGYPDASSYLTDPHYVGAMIGRVANRIRNGQILIGGVVTPLDVNELETGHCLHGGSGGFHSKRWSLARNDQERSVSCSLDSPDGDQGFSGNLSVRVEYRILRDFALSVELTATTDAPTVINLAHHPYFNLDRESSAIDGHHLRICAEAYTPCDDVKIPTGDIRKVAGTTFDFRNSRVIDNACLDQNFVLDRIAGAPGLAAELYSPRSKIRLRLRTTQPGLQAYTADSLDGSFMPRNGIALEGQNFPNAPNQPGFPSALLLPEDEYRHTTIYEFEVL